MRAQRTAFGTLFVPERFCPGRLEALLKGVQWCKEIEEETTHWERNQTLEHGIRLSRRWKGCTISVFPLVAAMLDMGEVSNICSHEHLPIQVNGEYVCILWDENSDNQFHVDAVASFIQLFNLDDPPLAMIPFTMHRALERGRIGLVRALSADMETLLCDALREQLGRPHDEIMDYIDSILTDNEWQELRESFPWDEAPELAVDVANMLLAGECLQHLTEELDHMWAIGIIAKFQPSNLDFFINHDNMRLAMHAVSSFEPTSDEEAWSKLSGLLNQDNVLGLMVHTKLCNFASLVELLQQHWRASWTKGPPANGALRHVVSNWLYFNRACRVS